MTSRSLLLLLILPVCTPALAEQLCHDAIAATVPDHYYRHGKPGTVIDKHNHLMWHQCSIGQQWKAERCQGEARQLSFDKATTQPQQSNLGGFTDWRLPTIHELSSLAELRCYQPAINVRFFPNTPAGDFWTSTVFANKADMAWLVNFRYGENHTAKNSYKAAVRLVRDVKP